MTFKILKTSAGNWYWHLVAANGQKVCDRGRVLRLERRRQTSGRKRQGKRRLCGDRG
jgi:hypothetical protein